LLGLNKDFVLLLCIPAALVTLFASFGLAYGQSACGGGVGSGAERRWETQFPAMRLGAVCDHGTNGFTTVLASRVTIPRSERAGAATGLPDVVASAPTLDPRPAYCRRDDYAFLPAGAMSGVSCDTTRSGTSLDPYQLAMATFGRMSLPSLELNMNPRLGMVAIPTWFWVEGYGGNVIGMSDSISVPREECSQVVERNESGAAVLDQDGFPAASRVCTIVVDTLSVEVRAWPRVYHWEFGDTRETFVRCPDVSACTAGLGRAYTDPRTPSPIRNAYGWSSLNVNGEADAYTVRLGITFGAQYRFSLNGTSSGGWEGLPDRELTWSAAHKVQEAQAVLTRGP
jgi:hypothetical protein